MGLYSRHIFPWLLDAALSRDEIQKLRTPLLAEVRGEVFEVGFGTGLNLPHYPPDVKRITAVDPNTGARKRAERRIAASSITVDFQPLHAERLPFATESFDSIVSTFTLCSIYGVDQAVAELRRVLKPAGRLFFLEHGLSDDPRIQWWQHKLTPLNRKIGDGCHLNRNAKAIIQANGFRIEHCDNFYLNKVPKVGGYIYSGTAMKI
jgi:ubiquinone/menaquinone biosynthesis C-methylase UbiE